MSGYLSTGAGVRQGGREEISQRQLLGMGKGLQWEGTGASEGLKRGHRAWTRRAWGPGTVEEVLVAQSCPTLCNPHGL